MFCFGVYPHGNKCKCTVQYDGGSLLLQHATNIERSQLKSQVSFCWTNDPILTAFSDGVDAQKV